MDEYTHYLNEFGISLDKAKKRALVKDEKGIKTAAKEMIGEAVIKKFNLFNKIYPNSIGYRKVTNKKLQKAGADYEVFFEDEDPVYVDLKSSVGLNYDMDKEKDFDIVEPTEDLLKRKGAPIEIYQDTNGMKVFTFTNGKVTDTVLFIFCDKDGISFCNMDYTEVRNFALKHKDDYEKRDVDFVMKKRYPFKRQRSGNGTGIFAKCPVFTVKLERRLNDY